MKIFQVIPCFVFGGAEIMCETLLYAQRDAGHEVAAVSLFDYHSPITERIENAGIKIYYMGKRPGPDLTMTGKLKRLFAAERPDAIHVHLNAVKYTVPAAHKNGIRCVYTVHNLAEKDASGISREMNRHFFKKKMATPVALSEKIKRSIAETYGLKESEIPTIFNGIDLSRCQVKSSYAIGERIELLHVGRFFPQKNHKGLIDAFKIIKQARPEATLRLLGDGSLLEEIKAYAKEQCLEDSVIFEGAKADVYPYLASADIFMLPSLYEGMPITLIEAMGSALPIVATAVGGVPDMLTDGHSAALTDCTPEAVAAATLEVIGSEELREKYGRAAKADAERFSAKIMAERYVEVYLQK